MTSNLLNNMGLGSIDIGYFILVFAILILVLLILLIIVLTKQSKLKKRYEAFMCGSDAASMEKEIAGLFQDIDYLKKQSEKDGKEIKHIYKRMETVFQKVGIVKYDAFKQMGGQLSFCIALLDENNNGFIMNSVHSTDSCYSYTKVIQEGECDISLGDEEQKALEMAVNHEFLSKEK